jgi:hypothetical protein
MGTEILKSELDIFKSTNYQTSIENSKFIQIRPTSSISNSATIEFDIPLLPEEYYDLQNLYLSLKANVTSQDNSNFTSTQDNRISLINYSLNTIWEQVDVFFGNTPVSHSSNTYPYRAWIELLTSYNKLALETHLRSAGFLTLSSDPESINTSSSAIINSSKEFTLFGRLHSDVFNSDRLLINGVSIRIVLTKGRDSFNFIVANAITANNVVTTAEPNPKLNILDASLFIRKVSIAPNLLVAHSKAIQHSSAKYPIKRKEVKVINLASGQSVYIIDNVFMSQIPCTFIIGLVQYLAQSGDLKKNALSFNHRNLNYIALHINGDIYPTKAYEPDNDKNKYEREYFEFFNNMGSTLSSNCASVTFEQFKSQVCLYVFNFNSDFDNPNINEYINLAKEGFLNIEIHFSNSLTEPLKLVCYAVFDNLIEIDAARNVTTDY